MGDNVKKTLSITLFVLICAATAAVYKVYGDKADTEKARIFLKEYGWEVSDNPNDIADITIPEVFDRVYENYNEIQKSSGLDLYSYRGKKGVRYTFVVTNYPVDVGEPVYANVILINGTPVGGDIMTVSLSGFMHGLSEHL